MCGANALATVGLASPLERHSTTTPQSATFALLRCLPLSHSRWRDVAGPAGDVAARKTYWRACAMMMINFRRQCIKTRAHTRETYASGISGFCFFH